MDAWTDFSSMIIIFYIIGGIASFFKIHYENKLMVKKSERVDVIVGVAISIFWIPVILFRFLMDHLIKLWDWY